VPEALALVLALLVLAGTLAAAVVHSRWPVEALAAAGGAALLVAVGALSVSDARHALADLAPTVGFLAALLVLAEGCRREGLFAAMGGLMAVGARGSPRRLLALVFAVAATVTAVLSLDATVVLLTPIVFATAARLRTSPRPHVYACSHLANSASLLLPVSNLTNLLAADRIALSAPAFAARMWAPQLASMAATMIFLWVFYWRRARRGADVYTPPAPIELRTARERVLFRVAGAACLLFVAAIPLIRDQIGLAALAAAGVAVVAFAVFDRSALRLHLIPWQLLILVTGLFLVVPTLSRYGLAELMTALIGTESGPVGAYRAAATGAGLSNLLNNLPAYTAGEAVVPPDDKQTLLALLIGTNVGSIVTPWASLATLLCLEACRKHKLRVPLVAFVLVGLGLAVTALAVSVGALLLTGP